MTYRVLTISRQFGAGGHTLGQLVAEKLNIPFYDSEIIEKAVADTGFSPEFVREAGEYASTTHSFLFNLALSHSVSAGPGEMSNYDKIYIAQARIIRDLAEKSPCVIVGRCADYILENRPELVRVFLYGDLKDRVARKEAMGLEITESDMTKHVQVTDRKRSRYYRNFTGQVWGAKENYDICLNTSVTGIDGAVAMLKTLVENRNKAE